MSERIAIGHAVDLPDGSRGWRRFTEPETVGRITVVVHWNRPGRREFQGAIAVLRLAATEVQTIGTNKKTGEPILAAFSVQGAFPELDALTRLQCVEEVIGVSGRYGTRVHSESAVPRSGCGNGSEKPRPKAAGYCPCLPIVPMPV